MLRVSLYDPDYFMPSQSSFNVMLNIPAYGGTFNIEPSEGFALQTEFFIQLSNYLDEDLPLMYKFSFYLNGDDYLQERINGTSNFIF